MLDKAQQYLTERGKWVQYGKPLRTPERIEELYNICIECEQYEPKKENVGNCALCGCYVRKAGKNMNKLSYATTRCPLEEPKWIEEPEILALTEEQLHEQMNAKKAENEKTEAAEPAPKKRGGCGCGKK
jgi:hypothetical protein